MFSGILPMTTDTSAPQLPPESRSRGLIRSSDRAVLSTAMTGDGWPYGSLVMTACDHAARPLLLISELAEHTKNLATDTGRRCCSTEPQVWTAR